MKKAKDAIFGGALALQAVPMLGAGGRTPAALTDTTTGFINIGVAGATAGVAFEMVKAPYELGLYKKNKKLKRRR